MKLGFSSLVCPSWGLDKILQSASELGFDGVELRGLRGDLNLPLVPELSSDPAAVRTAFAEKNVEIVCLAAALTLDSKNRRELAKRRSAIIEYIELASRLGCPYVRLNMGEVQRFDNYRAALGRIADAIRSLVPVAARNNVVLVVENGGDFPGSEAVWFVADVADHPAVRVCWNQCYGMTIGEQATISIPRLGNRIGFVHLCDAEFDDRGLLSEYKPLGQGQTEVAMQIELLKGMMYDRYLIFEWPKLWMESLPDPDETLPGVASFLRERLEDKQAILTAYKGDKKVPRFAAPQDRVSSG